MVMRIRETSVISHAEEQSNGNQSTQWKQILDYLNTNGSKTRGQLAHELKMEKSTISARINLLKNKRLVIDEKKTVCPISKKTVHLVEVKRMTNNEVRAYLKSKNITTENITDIEIIELRFILNKHLRNSGIYNGTAKLSKRKPTAMKYITVDTEDWKKREAISFNSDGFIGIAGWADSNNTKPFIDALIEWANTIRGTN